MPAPALDQLRKALQIAEQIEALKVDLASFFGGTVDIPALVMAAPMAKIGKRRMSPEAKARIAAAQKARWAKQKATHGPETAIVLEREKAEKKRRKMSGEAS